ncbi:MAG TPA: cytochrome c [Pedobacter sp.]
MRRTLLLSIISLTLISIIYSCQTAEKVQLDAYYVNGRDLYISRCQNCHGSKGEGLGELVPPLTDSVFLKNNKSQLACIIKRGFSTPVKIHDKVYEGKMPDFNLADIDIAQLIVYITNDFGHKQGMYTNQQVAQDLKNCK